MDEVREEIKVVKNKILAVEFLLPSYGSANQDKRQKEVKDRISEAGPNEVQHYVNIYVRCSEVMLQDILTKLLDEKKQLQEKEMKLLDISLSEGSGITFI
jgi:NAD(P)H-flavin reductase